MLESMQAMSLLTIMEIVGPVLLLAVLIYGTLQWSRRRRGPTQAVREAATRELYREGARAEKREEAGEASAGDRRARDRSAMAVCSKSKLTTSRAYFGRYEQTCPPCPYCHEPMTPVFTIAEMGGRGEAALLD